MNYKIAIIGLGYVGLPLAVEFAKKYSVLGFDVNNKRVNELDIGYDYTLEVSKKSLRSVLKSENQAGLRLSHNSKDLKDCNVFIVTVPTPVGSNNKPLLAPLIKASKMIGSILKKDDIVIYESTVYPGATEDECVPVLEKESGLTFNKDFYCGYSPERINPGDILSSIINSISSLNWINIYFFWFFSYIHFT